MKKNVSISIDFEKLSALEMYLGQKNLNLSDELDKCIESLYQKNVPQNVRDFLKMKESAKPSRKTKKYCSCGIRISIGEVTRHVSHDNAFCEAFTR